MFEQPEPARPSLSAPMKLMAISVAGVLLSFGICGIAAITPEAVTSIFSGAGAVVFGLGILGMVISVLWFFLAMIVGAFRR